MTVTLRESSRSTVSIALTGSGGSGVMTAGNMLLEAAAIAGCYGLMGRSSGPQIRGGEAAALLRIGQTPVDGQDDQFQILLAVDWVNIERFADEIPLAASSLLVGDPAQGDPPAETIKAGPRRVDLPMKELSKQIPGGRPNMIAVGYVAALVGLPMDAVVESMRRTLGENTGAITPSLAAIEAGFAAGASVDCPYRLTLDASHHEARWLLTGNEAVGYGAIKGGIRFVAAYPITPATEVLEWMSAGLTDVGGVLVQAEDELASINMAIGASYGGTPSLTATSGPGLSLMIESFGLAVASETPIVVIDVMRVGPSTGIATKSEQSDLNIALYGMHGDAPHIVVAPNSVSDCLTTAQWAVHLAEQTQSPVILLSDQAMGQTRTVIDQVVFPELAGKREIAVADGTPYKRYKLTESGVSPMSIPGTLGLSYTADGLEHNERGTPSSQASDHQAQLDKRLRKITSIDYGAYWADIEGDGEVAVIAWGSCTGPAREAVQRAHAEGVAAKLISMRLLSPVRPEQMAKALAGVKRLVVVEQTHSGQFFRHLRSEYNLPAEVKSLHRAGPLAIRPQEIHRHLVDWSNS